MGSFTLYQILFYFIIYAFVGWCIEVVFCSVNTGQFVNRGFLNGPLCPIYGFGAVIILVLLEPLANSLLLLFLASVVLTSALELLTGFLLKKLFHTTWWDYSNQPFNIGGYVCLKFSLLWGVACLILVKAVHPLLADLVDWLPKTLGWVLLAVFYAALLADLVVTVAAIRKWNRELGELTRLAEGIHAGSDRLAKNLGNTAIAVADKVEALELEQKKTQLLEKMETDRERLAADAAAARQRMDDRLQTGASTAKQRYQQLLQKRHPVREHLMRAFPDMRNLRHPDALEALRKAIEERKARGKQGQDEKEDESSN
ncbi:MAG: hypothetical protein AB7V55_08425 [Oscillospiraceae bacterium]